MGRFRLNFLMAVLVILTITVQIGAIWMAADQLQEVDAPAPVESSENQASTAVPILVLLLAELVIVWVLFVVYRRLPEIIQRAVKLLLIGGGLLYALLYAAVIMPILFVAYGLIAVAYVGGYKWVSYDIGALVLAVVIAATLGGYFGPVPIAMLVVALLVYDWVAVVETSIMSRVMQIAPLRYLPLVVVIPKTLSFDIADFLRRVADGGIDADLDDARVTIGAGDFAIPAALTAAVFRFHGGATASVVILGTVVGLLVLLNRKGEKPLPGLPWLGGGAVVAYGLALGAVGIF